MDKFNANPLQILLNYIIVKIVFMKMDFKEDQIIEMENI